MDIRKYFPGSLNLRDWLKKLQRARWIWEPLVLFLITRLGIALVAYLAVPLIADSTNPPPYHLRGTGNILLDVFGSRWDTGFYVNIAEEGYRYSGAPLPSVAFFPLYPLLMRGISFLVGDVVVAGILVSNIALLLAVFLLYRLVSEEQDQSTASRSVWYLLIYPAAFFGMAVYSESLFLLFAIGALYFARRNYWELAALFGIGAALTRLIGLIVALMLLVEWISQRYYRDDAEKPTLTVLLAPMVVPLGTISYMVYLQRAFGDPLAFIKAAAAWERQPQSPLLTIAQQLTEPAEGWWSAIIGGRIHIDNWIDLLLVLTFILLAGVLLYQKCWSEGIYVLSGVLLAFSSGLLMSQRRYVWILFPAFIVLAKWGKNPVVDRFITVLSLSGLVLFTVLFANGYWVG
ncbi:MAG: hypothetical protein MUO67_17710 [Anaerolineales bacterium]|nr:hypothetical protein [Anaerolineales bacterium]